MSVLIGRWSNPEGGETVEFTVGGAMVVSRDGEVLATQLYATEESGTGGGRLSLRTEGSNTEVMLGFHVEVDVLAMAYGDYITMYNRVSG